MTNDKTSGVSSADQDASDRIYNAARADWHSHRAAIAVDSSARMLHEKFATLYRARAEDQHTNAAVLAKFSRS